MDKDRFFLYADNSGLYCYNSGEENQVKGEAAWIKPYIQPRFLCGI